MGEIRQGEFGGAAGGTRIAQESFTADELRLLQSVMQTDRKTLDYIETVVGGTDLTERRAHAGLVTLKIRRMLDGVISQEMADQTAKREELAQHERKRQAEEAEKARVAAETPPEHVPEPEPVPAPEPEPAPREDVIGG